MGIRGELYSTRVGCEGRTYFFNVKENRMGDMFLTVVESKPNESEGFERRSVVVFKEDLQGFLKALQGALDFMAATPDGAAAEPRGALAYDPKPAASAAPAAGGTAPRKPRAPSGFAGKEEGAPRKRIVVKRKPAAPGPASEG